MRERLSGFDLRDLERFMAIVEHRSFGRAAEALGMTQPALSRHIATLERSLGLTLFSRERRQIELTAAGLVLSREARAILAQVAAADRALRHAGRGSAGHLRIGTRSIARFRLIPAAVRDLRRRVPGVEITFTETSIGLQIDHLARGAFDVTLLRGPIELSGGLRTRRLRSDPFVVALPAEHRLASRASLEVRDLVEEPFIDITRYPAYGYRELMRAACAREGFVPRVVQVVESAEALMLCVASGLGIGLLHDASVELDLEGVVYRPLRPEQPLVDLLAIWRGDDTNPVLPVFLDSLTSVAGTLTKRSSENVAV
ncbi:MAG TPA: LysR substrate-binding domain-containing protein [Candidatus Elarobacter sp.]|jgi:DNA-binding transcriptional LysR family regulator|nr:LysR substrate-binding domain-containing protein [Candidatus Elarobacter sp.]